ncbi:hypothetical protein [Marisediminicola senii]|uniref:hypothetical protein n=1 Tax=Marisediminicola senii TaxID=2711233 RepID=UPI0013EBF265|nr:hypothetical protein [Marisediminicola senii]
MVGLVYVSGYAGEIPRETAELLAVAQRPLAAVAFEEAAPVAAWESRPGWRLVLRADRTVNPDVERFGYERAHFEAVSEVDAPHRTSPCWRSPTRSSTSSNRRWPR